MADQFIMNYFTGHSKGGDILGGVSEVIIEAEDPVKGIKRKVMAIYNNSTNITMWLAFDGAGCCWRRHSYPSGRMVRL